MGVDIREVANALLELLEEDMLHSDAARLKMHDLIDLCLTSLEADGIEVRTERRRFDEVLEPYLEAYC